MPTPSLLSVSPCSACEMYALASFLSSGLSREVLQYVSASVETYAAFGRPVGTAANPTSLPSLGSFEEEHGAAAGGAAAASPAKAERGNNRGTTVRLGQRLASRCAMLGMDLVR